jgi:cell division protein FtsB
MDLENASTIDKNDLKQKAHQEQKKKNNSIKFYRSFLTVILLFCILQIGYSAILNITKLVVYQGKINKSVNLRNDARERNKYLKKELDNNSSMERIEYIARNKLKMAGEGEVLVIISENKEEPPPKNLKEKILRYFSDNFNK